MDLPKPWQACLDAFLQAVYDRSGSYGSLYNYRSVLRRFFSDPTRTPDTYTQMDVRMFLDLPSASNRNYGKPVSAAAKNARLEALASFYRFSATYEIDGKPLLQSKPPTYGIRYLRARSTPHYMNASELETFFSVIPANTVRGLRDRAIFLTYFWTGRRRSEIARLVWHDIEQTIIVEQDGTRRPGYIYRYITKGKSREIQTAELPTPAWQAILSYLNASNRLDIMQSTSPLFAAMPGIGRRNVNANDPITGNYINELFKQYAAKAGLSPLLSLHSLRHTAAHERYLAGEDILSLMTYLGHASLDMTRRYLVGLTGLANSGAHLLYERFGHLSSPQ